MKPLLTMSLTGSIVLVIYFILSFSLKSKSGFRWHTVCLKAALFFYLIPVGSIKYLLPYKIFSLLNVLFNTNSVSFGGSGMVSIPIQGRSQIVLEMWIYKIMEIWFIITFLYICWQIITYFYAKHKLLKNSIPLDNVEAISALELFPELNKIYHRKRVKIFRNPDIPGPFTAGIFTNLIILPKVKLVDSCTQNIYGHELYHIKNRDVLLKSLCILAIGLHWYNPCVYLLLHQICKVSEYYCDECVIKNMGKEKRLEYGKFLVYMGSQVKNSPIVLSNGLFGKKKELEKRIRLIINYKKVNASKKLNTFLTLIFIMIFVISMMLYQANIIVIKDEQIIPNADNLEKSTFFYEDGASECYIDPTVNLPFFINDKIFDDEYGNKYYGDPVFEHIECQHRLLAGTSYQHEKKTDGSCNLLVTEANRCDQCKKTYKSQWINSSSHTNCPHSVR